LAPVITISSFAGFVGEKAIKKCFAVVLYALVLNVTKFAVSMSEAFWRWRFRRASSVYG